MTGDARRPGARLLLLTAALVAALLLAACGGDDSTDSTSAAADTSSPEGTAEAFIGALISGDGEGACALVSADASKQISGGGSCEEEIVANVGDVSDEDKADAEGATYEVSDETDNTAVVTGTLESGETQQFQLVLEDGEWKIDG